MRLQKTIVLIFTILIMLTIGQGCRFVNVQIMERKENMIPSGTAFKIYPSITSGARTHYISAHPINGKYMRLYFLYKSPHNWEVSKAEYSVDNGRSWQNFPFTRYTGSFRKNESRFVKIHNRKDSKERNVYVRAWFIKINQEIDFNTGRIKAGDDDEVGPIMTSVPLYHSRR